MQIRKSKSGFTTGDKVYLQKLAVGKLQELSAGHGGWNADMERVRLGLVYIFVFKIHGLITLSKTPKNILMFNPFGLI